jgi:multiple sugar transport system permease protein
MQPATVVLAGMTSQFGVRWNDLMAASTIVALPVLAIFVFLQRYVVSGLTEGATKG